VLIQYIRTNPKSEGRLLPTTQTDGVKLYISTSSFNEDLLHQLSSKSFHNRYVSHEQTDRPTVICNAQIFTFCEPP